MRFRESIVIAHWFISQEYTGMGQATIPVSSKVMGSFFETSAIWTPSLFRQVTPSSGLHA